VALKTKITRVVYSPHGACASEEKNHTGRVPNLASDAKKKKTGFFLKHSNPPSLKLGFLSPKPLGPKNLPSPLLESSISSSIFKEKVWFSCFELHLPHPSFQEGASMVELGIFHEP
jgi:hypothetical protein